MFVIPSRQAPEQQRVACLNWPREYPYAPDVRFSIWHDGPVLHLSFQVQEESTRALQDRSGGFVYEDSCVEFFIQPDASDPHYYNFEWNAGGTLYLARRTSRFDPEEAPAEVLAQVKAVSSLGPAPFAEKHVEGPWTLDIAIPVSALWYEDLKTWSGMHARANLYKCGDGLKVPHYLTWAPIEAPAPDYHRPEFFVPVEFA